MIFLSRKKKALLQLVELHEDFNKNGSNVVSRLNQWSFEIIYGNRYITEITRDNLMSVLFVLWRNCNGGMLCNSLSVDDTKYGTISMYRSVTNTLQLNWKWTLKKDEATNIFSVCLSLR